MSVNEIEFVSAEKTGAAAGQAYHALSQALAIRDKSLQAAPLVINKTTEAPRKSTLNSMQRAIESDFAEGDQYTAGQPITATMANRL